MILKPKRLEYKLGTSKEQLDQIIENISSYYYRAVKRKKNGKERILYPSKNELKILQKLIKSNILEKFEFPEHIQGGIKKRDNISNANFHLGKKFKSVTDVRNFFPTISYKQVYSMFLQNGCSADVSSYLTRLTTYKGKLPQGTPTSTHIANLVFIPIDNKILEICKVHQITYTRFVDDLSFSSQNDFRSHLTSILDIIKQAGFKISHRKTKYKEGKMEITGIITKNNVLDIKKEQKNTLENKNKSPESIKGLKNYTKRVKNRGKLFCESTAK